jgi:hypothetical protein
MAEGLIEEAQEVLDKGTILTEEGHFVPLGFAIIGVGVGLLAGVGVGYLLGKRKYEKKAEEEIAEMRLYFHHKQAATEARLKAPISEVVEYLGYKKAEDQPGATETEQVEVQRSIEQNVFDSRPAEDLTWDYDVEKAERAANPGKPYVIHLDEFGEEGYSTVCYTYYEDDEILADERDEPVDDVDNLVGLENLQKFGHGSDNVNIVMVRNDSISVDMEIAKSAGKYSDEVGFLQHNYSVEKMRRRHRGFDDD